MTVAYIETMLGQFGMLSGVDLETYLIDLETKLQKTSCEIRTAIV